MHICGSDMGIKDGIRQQVSQSLGIESEWLQGLYMRYMASEGCPNMLQEYFGEGRIMNAKIHTENQRRQMFVIIHR
jgi:hypothetical protein